MKTKFKSNVTYQIFLVVCVCFFCFLNGIKSPQPKAAKGKQEDCKKIKAILKEHGHARGDFESQGPEASSPTKTYSNYKNIYIVKSGNKVPLEDGSIIYFSYQIQNLPKDSNQVDGFKILLTFPEMINPSGEKFTRYQVPFSIFKKATDDVFDNEHYWSFSKSDPYEMVEGPFTYHLYYKSCLLLQYTFYTYTN